MPEPRTGLDGCWCLLRVPDQCAAGLHREVSELVVAQIRLLRETRASIVGDDEDAWAMLPMHARDRALANELRAEKKLHAALYPPAPDANVALGHYAVSPA